MLVWVWELFFFSGIKKKYQNYNVPVKPPKKFGWILLQIHQWDIYMFSALQNIKCMFQFKVNAVIH